MDDALQASAESESQRAFAQIVDALQQKKSFKLEAGAGAGKTFSLVQALDRILGDRQTFLPLPYQRVACLTYTNVARDEIRARVGLDSAILVDTLHGFLWEMIAPFQKPMMERLRSLGRAQFDELDADEIVAVEYTLGIPSVRDQVASLHHEDVPSLAAELFREKKFVKVIADRFPVVFVDEYQDTPAGVLEAALVGFDGLDRPPIVGLFGDAWQQIYDGTCGSIEHQGLSAIPKKANFRSDRAIVDLLNKLRPSLPQAPSDNAMDGSVTVFHTNHWVGERQKGQWKGQISEEATSESLAQVRKWLLESGITDGHDDVKILMLTHSSIGNELGYPSLSRVFRYNDSFIKKQDPTIEFFTDSLELALEAYEQRRFGLMFAVLGGRGPYLRSAGDKLRWAAGLSSLTAICASGTVGDVLDAIQDLNMFPLPSRVAAREADSRRAADTMDPRRLVEHRKLRDVSYSEIRALRSYLAEQSVFSTKHSVKGAEFDNVLVVVGRGWSKYDFGKMLAADPDADMNEKERASFERARNLFYVACSRAKRNLVLLFVQELDAPAEARLQELVGRNNIHEVNFSK